MTVESENEDLKTIIRQYVDIVLHDRKVIDNLQSRIDKAIEYIKRNEFKAIDGEICYFCNMKVIKELLNILKGEDKI